MIYNYCTHFVQVSHKCIFSFTIKYIFAIYIYIYGSVFKVIACNIETECTFSLSQCIQHMYVFIYEYLSRTYMTQTWRYIFRCNSHIKMICTICIYVRCTFIGTSVSVYFWYIIGPCTMISLPGYGIFQISNVEHGDCYMRNVKVRVSSRFLFCISPDHIVSVGFFLLLSACSMQDSSVKWC